MLFNFDLSSFADPDRLSVNTSKDNNKLELTCTSPSGKSNITWEFDAESKLVFRRFAIVSKEDGTHLLHIDDVKTGNNVSTTLAPTNIPEGTALSGDFLRPDGVLSFVELNTRVFDAISGHAALTNPKYRQMKQHRRITDWTSIVNQFQIDRPVVVKLFSVPGEHSE